MNDRKDGVRVFTIQRAELAAMMAKNVASLERELPKVQQAADDEPIGEVRENFQNAADEMRKQADETRFLMEHLAAGPFTMAASELIAFRRVYSEFEINLFALRTRIDVSRRQVAERDLANTAIQVPRVVLPSDVFKG